MAVWCEKDKTTPLTRVLITTSHDRIEIDNLPECVATKDIVVCENLNLSEPSMTVSTLMLNDVEFVLQFLIIHYNMAPLFPHLKKPQDHQVVGLECFSERRIFDSNIPESEEIQSFSVDSWDDLTDPAKEFSAAHHLYTDYGTLTKAYVVRAIYARMDAVINILHTKQSWDSDKQCTMLENFML